MTSFAVTSPNGMSLFSFRDLFDLTTSGPYPLVTLALGLFALFFAMRFDMSDPIASRGARWMGFGCM